MITAPRGESRWFVLALFTLSMVAASLLYGGIGSLVPDIGNAFGLAHSQLGLIATALLVGGVLTVIVSGTLCDRFGDKALLLESGLLMGGAMIAAALFPNFLWLLLCLLLYGAGMAAANPAGTHAILAFFPREQRGIAMGIRQMGMPLGGAVGGILFTLVAAYYGYRGALIAGGALVALVCTASALLYRQPKELCGEHVPLGKLLEDIAFIGKDRRLILVTLASMLMICVQTTYIVFFPITLLHNGFTAAIAALLYAGGHLCACAGRIVWGQVSDRRYRGNRMIPMAYCAIGGAAAAFLLGTIGPINFAVAALVAFGLGFAGEGWFGLALLAMAEIGGEEHAGGALGFGLTGIFLGGAIGPVVIGAVEGAAGYFAAWQVVALISLAATVPALLAARHQPLVAETIR